jgi:hypothetical protein
LDQFPSYVEQFGTPLDVCQAMQEDYLYGFKHPNWGRVDCYIVICQTNGVISIHPLELMCLLPVYWRA